MAAKTLKRRHPALLLRMLLLGALACLPACGALPVPPLSEEAYQRLQFDSETGRFDPQLSPTAQADYWRQWKQARRAHFLLNPDDAHGRQCGTHPYLQARWLLRTRFLPDFSFFLIRPGRRPCDYDQSCAPAPGDTPVTCAHTQYLLDYPVVIGPLGTPYRDYRMDRAFFNALIQSQNQTIANAREAERLARLYLFLTTTGSRNTQAEIVSLEVRPAGNYFQVHARLLAAGQSESEMQVFDVAADGSILPANAP